MNRRKNLKIGLLILSIIIVQSLFWGTIAFAGDINPKSLKGQCWKSVLNFMNKHDKYSFAKIIKAGKVDTYKNALVNVKVVIDPTLKKSLAEYDPNTETIRLLKKPDPSNASMNETIWHELTHRIEDEKGDINDDSEEYAERNIDYMTHLYKNVIPLLMKFEDEAKLGANDVKLKGIWLNVLTEYKNARKVNGTPAATSYLSKWFGFEFDIERLSKFYKEGNGGKKLTEFFKKGKDKNLEVWNGTWKTDWGTLVIKQSGNIVTGTYTHDNGKIKGKVYNNQVVGTWSEAPSYKAPKDAGNIKFTISADGKSFSGTWTYGSNGSGGKWIGTKLK